MASSSCAPGQYRGRKRDRPERERSVRLARWAQRLFFAGGVTLLAYCGFVLLDTWMFQDRENVQLEQLKAEGHDTNALVSRGLIGRIEIPRLGLSTIVMEGTDRATLRRSVGHIIGMALPGQPGNVGIAGHRDTFFRPLRNIRENDIITFTTSAGKYHYRVVSTKVVGPYDRGVLVSTPKEVLTLVTCYPFYFIGSAPERFIVRAERVRNEM